MTSSSLETSIQGQAPGRKLPFTRFHLGVTPVLDSLPEGMENVPLQVWTDFWSRADVVAKQVGRLDRMALNISLLPAVGACIIAFYVSFTNPSSSPTEMLLRILLLVACMAPLHMSCLYLKAYTFNKLKTFCSEEEAQTFLPLGFVLECHVELPTDRSNGYYLYFIPSTTNGNGNDDMSPGGICRQHGYLRVQVVKGPFCGWNTAPVLPYYDYLPSEMVSVSLADWSEFWAKVDAVSSTAVSSIRRHNLIMFMYGIGTLSTFYNAENDIAFLVCFLIVMIPLLLFWIHYINRCRSIDSDLENVCKEYADTFEQQGVYMEFRKELAWTWTVRSYWLGGDISRYIYLFPIMHPI
jgi:hypothetical protein